MPSISQYLATVLRAILTPFPLEDIIRELKGSVKPLYDQRKYEVKIKGRIYSVILHEDTEDGGYWVECPEIQGCVSQGDTVEEALGMIKDAISVCLQVLNQNKGELKAS